MKYLSVAKIAKLWGVSQRSVRNYCATGQIKGATLNGKTWQIPQNAQKPERKNLHINTPKTLLEIIKAEKSAKLSGRIYHKIQVDFTYNSNHIEGSKLTEEQTRLIFETNTLGVESDGVKVDDVIETANHFKCIDMIIDNANYKISERFIKELHKTLKSGTSDSRKDWFIVGDYKKLPNEVGGHKTTDPKNVAKEIRQFLNAYNKKENKTFDDLLAFHYKFETIHPFQDGNGRLGRLLLFKECLKTNITPFIITDDLKMFYYKGLAEWPKNKERLRATCLSAQDRFKKILDYFKIDYK
ncbi:MAG: Fic family protein [Elusimicrobiota bacterium]|jgi:Fic family protein|nr:Fic family protein [Elusimicrobiota bacterium]